MIARLRLGDCIKKEPDVAARTGPNWRQESPQSVMSSCRKKRIELGGYWNLRLITVAVSQIPSKVMADNGKLKA
jgi:hypothetical protein